MNVGAPSDIVIKLNVDNRTKQLANVESFAKLEYAKDNLTAKYTCRLINTIKSNIKKINNHILEIIMLKSKERIKHELMQKHKIKVNSFNNINGEENYSFTVDIKNYYIPINTSHKAENPAI